MTTPSIVPSIDESSLGDEERYKFLGWTQDKKAVIAANKNLAKLVNVPYIFSTSDMVFYACFVKESVYDSTTDKKYFQWTSASVQSDPFDNNSESVSGYALSIGIDPVSGLPYQLSGKITIPLDIDGVPVVRVQGLNNAGFGAGVTHVYFEQGVTSRLIALGSYAFAQMPNLRVCEVPDSVTQIGSYAFWNDTALKPMNFNWDNLLMIGTYAISNCFSTEMNDKILYFGGNIKRFDYRAVSNLEHSPREIVVGDRNHPSQLLLGGTMPGLIMRFNTDIAPTTITFNVSAGDYSTLQTMIETGGDGNGKRIQVGSGANASNVINLVFQ